MDSPEKEVDPLTISAFRKYIRERKRSKDKIVMLYPLDKLKLLSSNRKYKTHAVDPRSFVDADGYWNVYPIAIDRHHVYIVCHWCQEIHTHGNTNDTYDGHRVAHCKTINPGYIIQNFVD